MLARALVTLIIAFPILILHIISPKINSYLLFLVGSLIPFTAFSLLLFSVIDWICLKLRLYDRVDILPLKEPFFEDLEGDNDVSIDNLTQTS